MIYWIIKALITELHICKEIVYIIPWNDLNVVKNIKNHIIKSIKNTLPILLNNDLLSNILFVIDTEYSTVVLISVANEMVVNC